MRRYLRSSPDVSRRHSPRGEIDMEIVVLLIAVGVLIVVAAYFGKWLKV